MLSDMRHLTWLMAKYTHTTPTPRKLVTLTQVQPFFFFVEGPADLDKQSKRVDTALQIQACQTDMEVENKSNSASESSTTAYQRKCIETHRMCSRVAVGAMPMPCRCTATGSKCLQTGRTTCQQGPGQALCSRLPRRVQCRGGHQPAKSMSGCNMPLAWQVFLHWAT